MTRRAETVALKSGTCRICGCTELRPCRLLIRSEGEIEITTQLSYIASPREEESLRPDERIEGCKWVNAEATLCSNPRCVAEVPLEELVPMVYLSARLQAAGR